jgi:hypothetical protein
MTAPDDWPADQWRTAVEQFLDADAAYYRSPSILHHQTVRLRVEQLKAMRDGMPPMNGSVRVVAEPCLDDGPDA